MPGFLKYILPAFLFIGCTGNEDKGKLLAKVYEKELYQSDLDYLFVERKLSQDDSIKLLKTTVDHWVKEQIMVHEAENSDQVDTRSIDQRVENYRNDLLINEIEKKMIADKLDTVVKDQEILKYYNKNKEAFQLNDYLVKVLYLKIPFDAPDVDKIASAYKLNEPTDIEEVEVYARIYASNFYYDPENWIYFDDLLKEIPLQDIKKDRFIMKRSKIRFEENGFHYFLNIIDYKLKNTISPLEFEKENIKERIINTRIKNLRQEIRNEIIQKAYDKKAVTVY